MLGGDYNVCPTEIDVFDPKAFADDALCQPQSRAALRTLLNLGLTDAVRAFHLDTPATPSGTTRPAPGRRATGSGSTTCCCRRRPPTG